MFLDADDLPTAALPALLADLARDSKPFDVCIYKYADSRLALAGRWGQPDWDEAFWTAAAWARGPWANWPRPPADSGADGELPWNKIYRTAFLRQNRIGCAPTPVHQDIPLHWLALALADRMLVSDRICVWHQVAAGGNRLTNRRGGRAADSLCGAGSGGRAAAGAGSRLAGGLRPLRPRPDRLDRGTDRSRAVARLPRPGGGLAGRAAGGRGPMSGLAFVYLARGARGTFAALAEDIAALARPGDRVLVIEDRADRDTAARAAWWQADQAWGPGVAGRLIRTGTQARATTAWR